MAGPRRRVWRWVLWGGLGLVVIVLGLCVVVGVIAHRASSVWPETMPPPIEMPEPPLPLEPRSEALYLEVAQAAQAFGSDNDVVDGLMVKGPPPRDKLEAWRGSEAAQGALDRLLEVPGLQLRRRELTEGEGLPVIPVLHLVRARMLRGWWHEAAGRDREAAADMASALRLGLLMEHSGGTLIIVAVGGAVTNQAVDEARELIEHRALSRQALEELKVELELAVALPSGFVAALAGECLSVERAFDFYRTVNPTDASELGRGGELRAPPGEGGAGQGPRGASWAYDADKTIAFYRRECHRQLEVARAPIPSRPEYEEPPDLMANETLSQSIARSTDNPVGRALISGLSGLWMPMLREHDESRAARAMLLIRVALELYRLDHGGDFPISLDELAPVYLEAVPLDPFAERAFRYDPAAGSLESAGAGADEGQRRDEHQLRWPLRGAPLPAGGGEDEGSDLGVRRGEGRDPPGL